MKTKLQIFTTLTATNAKADRTIKYRVEIIHECPKCVYVEYANGGWSLITPRDGYWVGKSLGWDLQLDWR